MARRRRSPKWTAAPRPLLGTGSARVEQGADGQEYQVRTVPAARALKTYRCPGCDHTIPPGTAHVLAWPAGPGESGVEDRRHWHRSCWENRQRRGPTRRWS